MTGVTGVRSGIACASALDGTVLALAEDGTGARMHEEIRRLFPICRAIAGSGARQTLDILSEHIPLERIEVPTGTAVFDWVVPPEWEVADAYVARADGARVIDLGRSNLHVVAYSTPVAATMSLAELRPHLHSLPDQPDAVPYVTSVYEPRWGFCLQDRTLRALDDGPYEVRIDSRITPGSMALGEAVLAGSDPTEVLFSTYVCHPSMGNDNLSGPVLLAFLYRALAALPVRRHTYRFVYVPETIGAIAYLAARGEHLRRSVVAGYVATCVGDDGPFTYKRSRRGDTLADRAATHVLQHAVAPERVRIHDFFPRGSDERQYCSAGFDLPVGSLMRSMYHTYPEYHTSLDDLDLVSPAGMSGSLAAYLRLVQALELEALPLTKLPYGEPFLAKRGLYPTLSRKDKSRAVELVRWLVAYADGHHDLYEIADRAGAGVWELADPLGRLMEAGVLGGAPS